VATKRLRLVDAIVDNEALIMHPAKSSRKMPESVLDDIPFEKKQATSSAQDKLLQVPFRTGAHKLN
jgi:hypothetical protein